MEIRRARTGAEAVWAEAVALLVSEDDRGGRLASPEELAATLADERCYLFLALVADEAVGLLSAFRFPDPAAGGELVYLYDLEVEESHRRRGIGSGLVEALVEACEDDDVGLVWAGTDRDNVGARRTFESTGAELEGDRYVEYEWDLDEDD